jgi:hypothetical protein
MVISVRRDVTSLPPVWVAAVLDHHNHHLYETAACPSAAEAARQAEEWTKAVVKRFHYCAETLPPDAGSRTDGQPHTARVS